MKYIALKLTLKQNVRITPSLLKENNSFKNISPNKMLATQLQWILYCHENTRNSTFYKNSLQKSSKENILIYFTIIYPNTKVKDIMRKLHLKTYAKSL